MFRKSLLLRLEELNQFLQYLWIRPQSGQAAISVDNPVARTLSTGRHHLFAKYSCCFNELRIIHQDQSLKRRVCPLTAHSTRISGRRIENCHGRGWRGPPPKGVETSSIQVLPLTLHIILEDFAEGILFRPQSVWLIRLEAGSSNLANQQTCSSERVVPNHLG